MRISDWSSDVCSSDLAALRALCIAGGIGLVCLAFRLDRAAENRLYPPGALSVVSPVGLSLWILFIGGLVQTSVPLFLPLLLQVVHGRSEEDPVGKRCVGTR